MRSDRQVNRLIDDIICAFDAGKEYILIGDWNLNASSITMLKTNVYLAFSTICPTLCIFSTYFYICFFNCLRSWARQLICNLFALNSLILISFKVLLNIHISIAMALSPILCVPNQTSYFTVKQTWQDDRQSLFDPLTPLGKRWVKLLITASVFLWSVIWKWRCQVCKWVGHI